MSKLSKSEEVITKIRELVVKEAEAVKEAKAGTATGKPGADTNFQSVSESTEHTDKNKVGPEKLEPQEHEQEGSTDKSRPIAARKGKKAEEDKEAEVEAKDEAKEAAEVEAKDETKEVETKEAETQEAEVKEEVKAETEEKKAEDKTAANEKTAHQIGQEILSMIEKFSEAGKASGKPGVDTKYQAVSDKHDKTDKNKVGPEKLEPQEYEQHRATDKSVPQAAKKAEEAKPEAKSEDADKIASYQLGAAIAEELMKEAFNRELELAKEAGRRDFEQLIATAAEKLKQADGDTEKKAEDEQLDPEVEKQAEAAGAQAFHNLVKEAQKEYAFDQLLKESEEIKARLRKEAEEKAQLAKLANDILGKYETLKKEADEQKEMAKFAAMSDHITNSVIERLRAELSK